MQFARACSFSFTVITLSRCRVVGKQTYKADRSVPTLSTRMHPASLSIGSRRRGRRQQPPARP
eukprot:8034167-Alexandrium_andersonii.AAC.1